MQNQASQLLRYDPQQELHAHPKEETVARPKAKTFSRIPLRRKSDTTEDDAAHPLAKMKRYDVEKAKICAKKLTQHQGERKQQN